MDTFVKTFSFAGLTLSFISSMPIADSDGFSGFLSEKEPSLVINVRCEKLPEKSGGRVFSRDNHELYSNGDETLYFSSYLSNDTETMVDYACLRRNGEVNELFVQYGELWDTMIFEAVNISSLLAEKNAIILHCSCVCIDGEALLFTAPKQVGKSTQASLWEKYAGAEIINGDRMALRMIGGRLFACGTPYRGSSKISVNKDLPVRAIAVISQGSGNIIAPLNPTQAFLALYEGVTCDYECDETAKKVTGLIGEIIASSTIVSFECTPDAAAVEAMQNYLNS